MSSTFSAASAASRSASNEPACEPSRSARSTSSVAPCSGGTGLMCRSTSTSESSTDQLSLAPNSSAADFPASRSVPHRAAEPSLSICGPRCCASSAGRAPDGCSVRTFLASALAELTAYATTWKARATPSGRTIWTLRYRKGSASESGSSSWPTPTAKANHSAPSMRKWPAYRRLADEHGEISPSLWEWQMGFPEGWTDCEPSATPSRHT